MMYIDASVALAHLFLEDRRPPADFWENTLTASRLLQYEIWTVLHAGAFAESHGDAATALLGRIALLELSPPVLSRALGAFPVSVRTLDALHLASADYLRQEGQTVELATYDRRMADATRTMGIPLVNLPA
ncbi:MAG: type II toxin-antitoxin system VapC family toxin [Acidobacteria bacterium]|nr:type II toxin-antitoxin system VapC family toxin [Acidobacteriota bacterium]MYJ03240.1 type II toxin-antitoxin system VapC family toxin [Acidobacteriota bacterium]